MIWLLFIAAGGLAIQEDDPVARHAEGAAAAMRAGEYAKAEVYNREIVRLAPHLPEARTNLGLSLFLQKKYEEAISAFELGLEQKPEMANAWLFLGISYFNLNRFHQALPALERYTATAPSDFQGRYFLGLNLLGLERYREAEKSLLAARRLQPGNIDALYHLAQSYLGQARSQPEKQDALWHSFDEVIKDIASLDPESYRIGQLRAGFHEANGEKAAAIKELERLVGTDRKVRGLRYTLGCLYMEAQEYDKAHREFEAELALDAPWPRTWLQVGHVYVETEQPREALPYLERAAAVEPGSGVPWVELARAYRKLGRAEDAIGAYEKGIQLGERKASVYYQLARTCQAAGKDERAREALATSEALRREEKKAARRGK